MDLPLSQDAGVSDVSIVGTGDGGFLVGVVDQGGYAQFAAIAPDGTVRDAGYIDCNLGPCPTTTLSFVPGTPPTLVAGYLQPDGGGVPTSEFACWSDPAGAPGAIGATADFGFVEVLRAARGPSGIGVAIADVGNHQGYLAIGDGGCPGGAADKGASGITSAGSITPTLSSAVDPYVAAFTSFSGSTQDLLALFFEPSDKLVEPQTPYGTTAGVGWVTGQFQFGLAADGVNVTALTGDPVAGLQLYSATLGGTPLFDGGTLSAGSASDISAVNCGRDCTFANWIYSPDGGAVVPLWAVVNAEGCGQGQAVAAPLLPPDAGALFSGTTAVASQAGSSALATAYTYLGPVDCGGILACGFASQVYVQICTP